MSKPKKFGVIDSNVAKDYEILDRIGRGVRAHALSSLFLVCC